ncbi:MAG: hypothetical protein WAW80_01280 [Candidatus Saccharimonadales bacterium]
MPSKQIQNLNLWIYVPLWLFFAYLYWNILGFTAYGNTNIFLGGLYFIQFGVHEASHIVFVFLPPILTASAGSLGEIAFTSLIVYASYRAKSYFAMTFGLIWLMLAMTSAGNYMADARTQAMPLVGPSENPQHDWHFVFSQLGWLNNDIFIGGMVKIIGDVLGAVGLILRLIIIINELVRRAYNRS